MTGGTQSRGGAFLSRSHLDNLIIDRYDPQLRHAHPRKLDHMRSENSEDVITWNVFRSLRQVRPAAWIPGMFAAAFPGNVTPAVSNDAGVTLWRSVAPPPGLLESGPEGDSEVDVILEDASWVWFIEAKYKSDLSPRTTARAGRNQLLRNIDVGSHFAGPKSLFCSVLVVSGHASPEAAGLAHAYADLTVPRDRLAAHRPDGLANLCGVGMLTWSQVASVLAGVRGHGVPDGEVRFADVAYAWLAGRGLAAP